jgi:hypothetical protein
MLALINGKTSVGDADIQREEASKIIDDDQDYMFDSVMAKISQLGTLDNMDRRRSVDIMRKTNGSTAGSNMCEFFGSPTVSPRLDEKWVKARKKLNKSLSPSIENMKVIAAKISLPTKKLVELNEEAERKYMVKAIKEL